MFPWQQTWHGLVRRVQCPCQNLQPAKIPDFHSGFSVVWLFWWFDRHCNKIIRYQNWCHKLPQTSQFECTSSQYLILFFRHLLNHYFTHHTFMNNSLNNSLRFLIFFNNAMHCKNKHTLIVFLNEFGVILPRDFLPKQPSGSKIALSVRGLWPLNDLQTDNLGLRVLLH